MGDKISHFVCGKHYFRPGDTYTAFLGFFDKKKNVDAVGGTPRNSNWNVDQTVLKTAINPIKVCIKYK